MTATDLLAWGIVAHLVSDWLLQNHWMATNKTNLRHPAAWYHSGIHTAALLPIFGWKASIILGVSHLLIDTRRPLAWWREMFGQTRDPANPASLHVAIWGDQTCHVICIALAAAVVGR